MNPKSTPECSIQYVRAAPKDWRATAQIWFGPGVTPQQVDAFLHTTQHDESLARGWWVARRGEDVVAVQLVMPQAGAMAVSWPPTCRAGFQSHFRPLWTAARQALQAEGTHLFQCLVPVQDVVSEALMTALGFERITELITMRCKQEAVRQACQEALQIPSVAVMPVAGDSEAAFAQVLFETYEGSNDAPEMDRYQQREDILAGYQAPTSQRWLLRDETGANSGALVLTVHDQVGQLNYLGIVPAARRHGLARTAVVWALTYFQHRQVRQILVRLDARNEPALRLYARCGFQETHRDVLLVAR